MPTIKERKKKITSVWLPYINKNCDQYFLCMILWKKTKKIRTLNSFSFEYMCVCMLEEFTRRTPLSMTILRLHRLTPSCSVIPGSSLHYIPHAVEFLVAGSGLFSCRMLSCLCLHLDKGLGHRYHPRWLGSNCNVGLAAAAYAIAEVMVVIAYVMGEITHFMQNNEGWKLA